VRGAGASSAPGLVAQAGLGGEVDETHPPPLICSFDPARRRSRRIQSQSEPACPVAKS
jgi:hypothetical protein